MSPAAEPETRIEGTASEGFAAWMSRAGGSLAVTAYQAGKLAFIGWNGYQVSLLMRQFDKPLGLAVEGERLAIACRHEVLLYRRAPLLAHDYLEDQPGRYDALYLPRATYFTGDFNIHDIAFGHDGLWLVNSRFSCLAAPSSDYNFEPRWQPRFISQLAPEDRCHLNGLAMHHGRPKYVTALGESDEVGGWRANKATGGILIDVDTGQVVLRGLSMPHSPRLYRGQLWLLNSGTGELWVVDPQQGCHRVICTLPGYLRGLAFIGPFALVGLCQIRERHIFGGLPVQERFGKLLCGIAVVDLRSGQQIGLFEFTSGCQELYDIQFLPGPLRATILAPGNEAVRQAFTAREFSYWLRPSSLISDASGNAPAGPSYS